ncbi:MAG: hypothetical protein Q8Q85_12985 [Gemmatimonadales bacterium]|nr:hypothetical protein [Gemmatimonadales bacterium]
MHFAEHTLELSPTSAWVSFMPVTAKPSKRFYDALGEDVANELVEWFNSVDATYKADLRDLIEVQAQRFDARLEQRIGVLDAKLDQRIGVLDARLDQRIHVLDAKLEQRNAQLGAEMRAEMSQVVRRIDSLETKLEAQGARSEGKLEQRLAEQKAELLKWLFLFWVGTSGLSLFGILSR